MPPGQAVNDYSTEEWHQRFARVDDVAALVTEGYFMAKVDIQSAYRHVSISRHSQRVTGLKWQFGNYLRDTKIDGPRYISPFNSGSEMFAKTKGTRCHSGVS